MLYDYCMRDSNTTQLYVVSLASERTSRMQLLD
jgi:hypothetical protein